MNTRDCVSCRATQTRQTSSSTLRTVGALCRHDVEVTVASPETLSYGRPSSLPRSQAPLSMDRTASKSPSTREHRSSLVSTGVQRCRIPVCRLCSTECRPNGHLQISGILSQQLRRCQRSLRCCCEHSLFTVHQDLRRPPSIFVFADQRTQASRGCCPWLWKRQPWDVAA